MRAAKNKKVAARNQTAITELHSYIKEHFQVADEVNTPMMRERLPWITPSAVSAGLWKLSTEGILMEADRKPIGCRTAKCVIYMVAEDYMMVRGTENIEAKEPGLPREHKRKHK